jgi:phage terminase large subunit-like protein
MGIIYSGDEPDQLRGPQHDSAWVDEIAKFKYPQDTWDNLEMGLRLGKDPRVVVTTTPRPIPIIKKLLADPMTAITRGKTTDNLQNLSASFIKRVVARYQGTRLGRQELEGELLEDTPGALWTRDLIEAGRIKGIPGHAPAVPPMQRVVVAIDPAVTAGEDSDETGIIVAGLGRDGHGYTIDDCTLRGSPAVWARAAIVAYYRWHADRIIGEVNNGGDMVEYTIRTIDPNIAFRAVHATRGKMLRAEPVSAIYEQGRWHHVGMFAQLEDQLCDWQPGDKSPDRLDALVWAATELMHLEALPPRQDTVVYDSTEDSEANLGSWDR